MGREIDPADGRQLDGLLRRHRITLQHRLGQNFLIDQALRDAIAEASGVGPDDEVLEVGAGVGTLTIALAARCRRVVGVEFDRALIPALREVLQGHANVEVVQADVLRFDVEAAFPRGGEIVAGNIPYNLTGALVEEVFQFRRKQLGGTLARVSSLAGSEVGARLRELGIDAARRPQTLTLPEWERIYGAFNS